jgi:hypothetical protein
MAQGDIMKTDAGDGWGVKSAAGSEMAMAAAVAVAVAVVAY